MKNLKFFAIVMTMIITLSAFASKEESTEYFSGAENNDCSNPRTMSQASCWDAPSGTPCTILSTGNPAYLVDGTCSFVLKTNP